MQVPPPPPHTHTHKPASKGEVTGFFEKCTFCELMRIGREEVRCLYFFLLLFALLKQIITVY